MLLTTENSDDIEIRVSNERLQTDKQICDKHAPHAVAEWKKLVQLINATDRNQTMCTAPRKNVLRLNDSRRLPLPPARCPLPDSMTSSPSVDVKRHDVISGRCDPNNSSDREKAYNIHECTAGGKSTQRVFPTSAPCGLGGCKNRAHPVCWREVVKGVTNQGVDCFVS